MTVFEQLEKRFTFPFSFQESLLCLAVVGSSAHNTYVKTEDDSTDDVDLQGIFVPPPSYMLGIRQIESWSQQEIFDCGEGPIKHDWCLHALQQYGLLLLKSNPNILCLLYLRDEDYIYRHPLFEVLRENKEYFASQKAYDSFAGYAHSQLMRMEHFADADKCGEKKRLLIQKYGYDTKSAAHALRILSMGVEYVKTGSLTVWQPDDWANTLKDIKQGKYTLEEAKQLGVEMFDGLRAVKDATPLPKKSDDKKVNELLTNLHLEFWKEKGWMK